jgi:hypothetical protein
VPAWLVLSDGPLRTGHADISIDHARYALLRIHRPPAPLAVNSPTAGRRLRERAGKLLTRDFFQREHLHAGKNLATIEAETGIHRQLLAQHARQHGIRGTPLVRRAGPAGGMVGGEGVGGGFDVVAGGVGPAADVAAAGPPPGYST